jgi:hypothetical protein
MNMSNSANQLLKGNIPAGSTLRNLAYEREGSRKRVSSYDRTGGNSDYIWIKAGEATAVADITGSGCINHIWVTLASNEEYFLRKLVLRMYWDGESEPSVEVPIGDFFGMGHAMTKNFVSAPFQMSPEDGRSFNCWFAMPFASGARIEVQSDCLEHARMYFYIDYESYDKLPEGNLRFHAKWHREMLTEGIDDSKVSNEYFLYGGINTNGKDNYVILEAEGKGHFVGCHVNIHNRRFTDQRNWYGEGDDMIFIDGEPWPPSLHGTGTEDYFNTAWCPRQEVCAPYHGIILGGGHGWSGKITVYRYHIEDPIMFQKSIKVTIEHGHNNHRSDDWSSTAYWYQNEPHLTFEPLPKVEKRLPLPDEVPRNWDEVALYHHGPDEDEPAK